MFKKRLRLIGFLLFLTALSDSFGQQAQEPFGKNRIQYRKFKWKYISTYNFDIYYYEGGEELAKYAAGYAEADFERIEDMTGFSPYSKTILIIFNSIFEMQQSNIGLENYLPSTGGQTHFIKSKIEVAFTGNHEKFKKDISFGISQMMINVMLYGGSLKEMVQSSYLLSLPEWFVSGAASYIAYGWNLEMDDYMRNLFLKKHFKKPSVLEAEEATYAGQSIWNFIAQKYGKNNIANILNLTRILRNEESSVESTLGVPYHIFIREWAAYYKRMSEDLKSAYAIPGKENKIIKTKKGFDINDVVYNTDGTRMAYVKSFKGKYYVVLYDVAGKNKNTIHRGGNKLLNQKHDENVIHLAWQSNTVLTFIERKKDRLRLVFYDLKKGIVKKRNLDYNQVLSYSFSSDGSKMVLSADRKGQTDIYTFEITTETVKQITNDLYDDLDPVFTGSSSIIFSSNRISDTLGKDKGSFKKINDDYNLFQYDSKQTKILKRLTKSNRNFRPKVSDKENIFYLSDAKGIVNLFRYNFKSKTSTQVSGYIHNIEEYDLNFVSKIFAFSSLDESKDCIFLIPGFEFNSTVNTPPTERQKILYPVPPPEDFQKDTLNKDSTAKVLEDEEININELMFESDVRKKKEIEEEEKKNLTMTEKVESPGEKTKTSGPYSYAHNFSIERVNSTLLIDPLRGLGILMEVDMADMMGNHRMNAGLFGLTDLKSSNIFGEYSYLKRRVDFKLRYDRKTIYAFNESVSQRYTSNRALVNISYPLSVSDRISLIPFVFHTRFTDLDLNPASLFNADVVQFYGGLKGEYIYDNTFTTGLNMMAGTRFKLSIEKFFNTNSNTRNFGKLLFDFRNYRPIHRDLIFATRVSYGQFFGNAKKDFLLGGMDNWLFNSTEKHGPDDPLALSAFTDNSDLLFVEYVTNLRGFKYNTQYGSKYVLFNGEIRLPIVKYLYSGFINSNFFKNLQLTTFVDIGSAWLGKSPFSRDNSTNTVFVGGGSSPFSATVVNYKNPFLMGYGLGARTLFLGYYVKLDMAWAVVDYRVQGKKIYLTFGYDF